MARPKKTIQEIVQKDYPEFAEETNGLSVDQLNSKLATLAKYGEESEQAKQDDEELEKSQALAAELAAPYKDIKKALKAKTKYVYAMLKDKGAA